jgi:thiol-disulfide isomerase/thioredoxin
LQRHVNLMVNSCMAKTESTMLPLGSPAPEFELTDVISGRRTSLATFQNEKALLVMFICRHCPYVKHVQAQLAQIGKDYADRRVGIVAISSNDAMAYPDDAPAGLRQQAEELGFTFAYCYDESQDAARAFNAVCTPEFYVFDEERALVYRGQLDESRRHTAIPVTGRDVRAALDAVLDGGTINPQQTPSIGCSIKWRDS